MINKQINHQLDNQQLNHFWESVNQVGWSLIEQDRSFRKIMNEVKLVVSEPIPNDFSSIIMINRVDIDNNRYINIELEYDDNSFKSV